jgi:hypothetical protein
LAEYILSRCSTTILAKGTAICYRHIMPGARAEKEFAGVVDGIATSAGIHQA